MDEKIQTLVNLFAGKSFDEINRIAEIAAREEAERKEMIQERQEFDRLELSEMSMDDLTERLTKLQREPLKNIEERKRISDALGAKLIAHAAEQNRPQLESPEDAARRDELTAQLNELHRNPSKNFAESRRVAAELEKLLPRG